MHLDIAYPAAFISHFYEILENLQPVRVTEFSKATSRFAEPKRHSRLVQLQPHPCKEGRTWLIAVGRCRLMTGLVSLNKTVPLSPI